ncbi:transglutaminase-like domain-containing protein [Tomitella biformata]|uniref:transglutaminase-like domain-containing protein n=1 Tax=Tomitella biformata TaxID=630403 RepID=UPI000685BC34|nr:transglutaminase family protein [Tomitella biformata]
MTQVAPLAHYLAGCDIVQVEDPRIQALAIELRGGSNDEEFARRAFEHVRDEIAHSFDADDPRVTVTAREVLDAGVGLCYAKSHLLAALLRAGGVPTALCYQWLGEGDDFMLHGLVAVRLEGGWHRQDARGNKPGVDAQFSLAQEQLAWPVRRELGERDLLTLHIAPPQNLVRLLRSVEDVRTLGEGRLGIFPAMSDVTKYQCL